MSSSSSSEIKADKATLTWLNQMLNKNVYAYAHNFCGQKNKSFRYYAAFWRERPGQAKL